MQKKLICPLTYSNIIIKIQKHNPKVKYFKSKCVSKSRLEVLRIGLLMIAAEWSYRCSGSNNEGESWCWNDAERPWIIKERLMPVFVSGEPLQCIEATWRLFVRWFCFLTHTGPTECPIRMFDWLLVSCWSQLITYIFVICVLSDFGGHFPKSKANTCS